MRRLFILGLCFLFLTACASAPPAAEEPPPPEPEIQEPEPPPAPVQEPYEIKDPTQEQEGYVPFKASMTRAISWWISTVSGVRRKGRTAPIWSGIPSTSPRERSP